MAKLSATPTPIAPKRSNAGALLSTPGLDTARVRDRTIARQSRPRPWREPPVTGPRSAKQLPVKTAVSKTETVPTKKTTRPELAIIKTTATLKSVGVKKTVKKEREIKGGAKKVVGGIRKEKKVEEKKKKKKMDGDKMGGHMDRRKPTVAKAEKKACVADNVKKVKDAANNKPRSWIKHGPNRESWGIAIKRWIPSSVMPRVMEGKHTSRLPLPAKIARLVKYVRYQPPNSVRSSPPPRPAAPSPAHWIPLDQRPLGVKGILRYPGGLLHTPKKVDFDGFATVYSPPVYTPTPGPTSRSPQVVVNPEYWVHKQRYDQYEAFRTGIHGKLKTILYQRPEPTEPGEYEEVVSTWNPPPHRMSLIEPWMAEEHERTLDDLDLDDFDPDGANSLIMTSKLESWSEEKDGETSDLDIAGFLSLDLDALVKGSGSP